MDYIDLLFYFLFFAGIIVLQVYLSKRQSKWIGLILPAICLVISILAVMGFAVFSDTKVSTTSTTINENGKIVEVLSNTNTLKNKQDIVSTIIATIMIFIMSNIPTAVLLAIYFGCKEKMKKISELDKMNIQDLQ